MQVAFAWLRRLRQLFCMHVARLEPLSVVQLAVGSVAGGGGVCAGGGGGAAGGGAAGGGGGGGGGAAGGGGGGGGGGAAICSACVIRPVAPRLSVTRRV